MHIYSIKNEKLGFFNRPIYTESSQEALSYIQNILMSDADRALLGLKSDLALYYLGDVDFTSGKINVDSECPRLVCSLEEIFDTIPKDRVPNANKVDDLCAELEDLKAKLNTYSWSVDQLTGLPEIKRMVLRNQKAGK